MSAAERAQAGMTLEQLVEAHGAAIAEGFRALDAAALRASSLKAKETFDPLRARLAEMGPGPVEPRVLWRGSVPDVATDLVALLGAARARRLIAELGALAFPAEEKVPVPVDLDDVCRVAEEAERAGRGRESSRLWSCADEIERLRAEVMSLRASAES